MQRDWKTLGPKLIGKLHFAVGEMDTLLPGARRPPDREVPGVHREPGKGAVLGGYFRLRPRPPARLYRQSQDSPE